MRKTSVFGRPCPWDGCESTITRATGDTGGKVFSVRCAGEVEVITERDGEDSREIHSTKPGTDHRSRAHRDGRGLHLAPDPDDASLIEVIGIIENEEAAT